VIDFPTRDKFASRRASDAIELPTPMNQMQMMVLPEARTLLAQTASSYEGSRTKSHEKLPTK
jgi:hypothetical protein